jgi:ABC-type nickel/cobalt efflux system permease component RcnA
VKRLVVLLVLLTAVAAPPLASAHPLGNFTVNRFSRVEISGHRIYVRYVLDLAEIPTFQAGRIDPDAYAARIARGAHLAVDGRETPLVPVARRLAHPPGAGGLRTTRLELVLRGPRLAHAASLTYRDTNYTGRIGWKEIVVGADAESRSDELRAYPTNTLSSPLDVTSVSARVSPGSGPDVTPALSRGDSTAASDRSADGGFAGLVGRDGLSGLGILVALGAALFWGAAHALLPGHGKAIVTAYLVGTRGTPRHAALLGLITTVTHTIGVFALGGVTLLLSQVIVPETLYPWIELLSGILVVTIGASVLRSRLRSKGDGHAHHHHPEGDVGLHHHHHQSDVGVHLHHSHAPDPGRRGLIAVGISGGLLPCPSALVVLLAAISLHRVAFGMLLIVAFSVGLALAITGVGLLAVLAKRAFARVSFERGLVALLPAASAFVILVAGIVMTVRALPRVSL